MIVPFAAGVNRTPISYAPVSSASTTVGTVAELNSEHGHCWAVSVVNDQVAAGSSALPTASVAMRFTV